MKKNNFTKVLAPAVALSVILSACSGSGSEKASKDKDNKKAVKQELTMLETTEVGTIDTIMSQDIASSNLIENIFEGLYRLDEENNPVPAMADGEPTVSEDKKTYTFKIKDAKWSNGDPVTAENFVSAWRRAVDPDTGSVYGPYMFAGRILNADKIAAGKMKPEELGVKAIDEKTLEVKLELPIPYFYYLMAFSTFYPEPTNIVEKEGKNYAKTAENAVYNGPFVLEGWDGSQDVNWQIKKNESYWDASNVKLEKVNFEVQKDAQAALNMFQAGEADITTKLATQGVIQQINDDPQLNRYLEPGVFFLKFNQHVPELANENIRRAISTAFDKEALVNDVLNNGSIAANFIVTEGFHIGPDGSDFRDKNGDMMKYDLENAKKLWEKGLKEVGKKEITLEYVSQDTEVAKLTDAWLKNQLETNLPGLKLNVVGIPFPQKVERETKEQYDLLFAGWAPDFRDALTFMDLYITDGENNHMGYSNKQYDKLIKDAQTTYSADDQKRMEAMQEAERIVLEEDAAVAPIYQRSVNRMVSDSVKGYVYHLYGPEYCLKWAEKVK